MERSSLRGRAVGSVAKGHWKAHRKLGGPVKITKLTPGKETEDYVKAWIKEQASTGG